MAGDEISAFTQYYYQGDANNTTGSNLIEDLLGSLISVINSSSAASTHIKNGLEGISTELDTNIPFENFVAPDASNANGTNPKAYLTILFFDERFRFVEEGSLSLRVGENPGDDESLNFMDLRAPRNGYAFVYLSNESNEAVYFDNFQVRHNRGRIIEENHYYSFGLKITAISSSKIGDENEGALENNYKMQGMFSEMDIDIGWNDFALRNYDPQIGRWIQQDPYQQFASPYLGMGNDPVNIIDPSGGIGVPCPGTSQLAIFFMKAGENISKGLSATTGLRTTVGILSSAGRFSVNMYNNSVQFRLLGSQLQRVETISVSSRESNDPKVYKYTYGAFATKNDYDMDQNPHVGENVQGIAKYYGADLIWDGRGEDAAYLAFTKSFKLGSIAGFGEGNKLLNHFLKGDGSYKEFDEKSIMSQLISGTDGFKNFRTSFEAEVQSYLQKNKSLDGFDGVGYLSELRPKYLGGSIKDLFAWTVMGGYVKLEATITVHSNNTFSVKYLIGDHFGVGVGDSHSLLPGLTAMYYLQHYRGNMSRYNPFYWGVIIQK